MTNSVKPADELITEDDAFIANALKFANVPPLMMSVIHLTGDAGLLQGEIVPQVLNFANLDKCVSDADAATVRAKALDALIAYRDGGCKIPPPPSAETVYRMMNLITGTEVSKEYLPMLFDEMCLDGVDRRAFQWSSHRAPQQAKGFHILIIGAGMSGIAAAIRLAEAGLSYTVVEKNTHVGGTWYENSYPGCRVDSWNHFYSYSFEPNHDWSEFYSRRDELFAYFNHCTDKYKIRENIRFLTEVTAAMYDEERRVWQVRLRRPDRTEQTVTANAIISAVGQLNRPRIPDFPGREKFKGPAFHSAAWEKRHELHGKRIAVIGTGASAFQLIPELATIAGKLTVFQRAPGWMLPNPDYHRAVDAGKKWVLKHVPYYARWYRFLLFWAAGDGLLPAIKVDPAWPHMDRSVNALNEQMRVMYSEAIRNQVADRPDLIDKVVPKYPIWGKRMLQDNGHYLKAYKRDNVELVTDGIAEFTEDGIVDKAGHHHPLDVIVYATGFLANKFLWPMRIVGKSGKELSEVWGDEPRGYLGITVPNFPNFFCLYGPGTNLGHAGSIIFHAECQVRYVMESLKALIEGGHAEMDCKAEIYADYVHRLETELAGTVWAHPAVNNWYKNARGVVVNTSPWRLIDYWNWTKSVNLNDYRLAPVAD
jgi:4-hydroxyacetophenone monooxygenase